MANRIMSPRWTVGGLVAVLSVLPGVSPAASAQGEPDFTGVWHQGPGSDGLGSGWGSEFTVAQNGDTLTVRRVFFTRSDIQPAMVSRYVVDGTETINAVFMGRGEQKQYSTAVRNGDTVVIRTRLPFQHPETLAESTHEVVRRLWLESPRLPAWPPNLVIETTRAGVAGGPPSTTRTVYTRS